MPVTGKGKYPLRSAWLGRGRGRGRGLTPPVIKQVLPSVSEQAGYTALSDYFFDAAASGGITQSLAITLDGVTVAVNQSLQHSQSLAITLDGVTSSITQSLQHSQSMAITLDGVAVTINETLQHSQALAITLDGVTVAISQNASAGSATLTQSLGITLDDVSVSANQQLQHSQTLAITLDDIIGAFNQTLQHTQSLSISLDDITASISQNVAGAKEQSLSITLDGVSCNLSQQNISEELLTDTHDGFWRKQWEKKKKKPIVAEELAEFIEQVSVKEIAKTKVVADARLFEIYRQSIEINQQIADKLARIYQAELDQDDEEVLMLLGVY